MNWFKKLVPSRITTKKQQRVKSVPEGVWVTCDSCGAQLYRARYNCAPHESQVTQTPSGTDLTRCCFFVVILEGTNFLNQFI